MVFASTEKTQEQYWQESGVLIGDVSFGGTNCYIDLQKFRSCLASLNALAYYLEPSVRIIPSSLYNDKDIRRGPKTKNLSHGAVLVEHLNDEDSEEKISLRLIAQQMKTEAKKLMKEEEALFKQIMLGLNKDFTKNKNYIDFQATGDQFIKEISNNSKHKDKLAMIAGGAMNAAIGIYDAHGYLQPTELLEAKDILADKSFYGIGAGVHMLKKRVVINGLIDGGQAKKSKLLKVNDVILEVNDVSVKDMTLQKVVDLIRGPEGTLVKLLIDRAGEKKTVDIPRGKVELKNVQSRVLKDIGPKSTGYIKLNSFTDSLSCQKIADALAEVQAQKVSQIILDFRGNPGGLVHQALCIGGLFVGDKAIIGVKDLSASEDASIRFTNSYNLEDMIEFNKNKSPMALGNKAAERKSKLPLVVLINAGSASASEVLSGAFQDHKEAWIVGDTSFGKATVQTIGVSRNPHRRLSNGRTIQRFYQPSGRTNQIIGITPDFLIPAKPDATEDEKFAMREGDIFPTALPPVGATWTPNRPADITRIQDCLNTNKRALQRYEKLKLDSDIQDEVDYQLLSAQEVLLCDEETKKN